MMKIDPEIAVVIDIFRVGLFVESPFSFHIVGSIGDHTDQKVRGV
jgi:hypothetical protein